MDTHTIIGLIGAFGIGSLATTIVGHWLNKGKDAEARRFEEKKEAYRNFLQTWRDRVLEPTEENRRTFHLRQAEVTLVGSPKVVSICDTVSEATFNSLILAMREDLGIDVRKLGD